MEHYRGTSTDIVCCPLGRTHNEAIKDLNFVCLEPGIGYHGSYLNYRIFESQSILTISCQNDKYHLKLNLKTYDNLSLIYQKLMVEQLL
jgi:hypothetical protein